MNDNHDEKGRFSSGPGGGGHPGDRGSLGHTREERIKHYEGLGHTPESARERTNQDAHREATGGKPNPVGTPKGFAEHVDSGTARQMPKAPQDAHPKQGGKDPHPFSASSKNKVGNGQLVIRCQSTKLQEEVNG